MMKKKDILKSIEKTNVGDFVSRNYWKLTANELAEIVMEMDYAMYSLDKRYNGLVSYKEFEEEFTTNLYERWEDEIADEIKEEENGGAD